MKEYSWVDVSKLYLCLNRIWRQKEPVLIRRYL